MGNFYDYVMMVYQSTKSSKILYHSIHEFSHGISFFNKIIQGFK